MKINNLKRDNLWRYIGKFNFWRFGDDISKKLLNNNLNFRNYL